MEIKELYYRKYSVRHGDPIGTGNTKTPENCAVLPSTGLYQKTLTIKCIESKRIEFNLWKTWTTVPFGPSSPESPIIPVI